MMRAAVSLLVFCCAEPMGLAGLLWLFIYLSWPICPLYFWILSFDFVCLFVYVMGSLVESQFGFFSFEIEFVIATWMFLCVEFAFKFPIYSFFVTISIVFHLSFFAEHREREKKHAMQTKSQGYKHENVHWTSCNNRILIERKMRAIFSCANK